MSSMAAGGLVHARSSTRARQQVIAIFTACPPLLERPGGLPFLRPDFDTPAIGMAGNCTDGPAAQRRLPKIPRAEIVAADQSVQSGPAHRQEPRGLGDVAARLDERVDERAPLGPVARLSQGCR